MWVLYADMVGCSFPQCLDVITVIVRNEHPIRRPVNLVLSVTAKMFG